ncbi:uncharacterized protein LOC143375390 isoform X2 [Andrena cerasifolii]|uniref:uncharacterized protein LOC143375390 isoform X2 n=1 Tax=Andrena cerasifolii TaxID=2819439 RepID=UPI004037C088
MALARLLVLLLATSAINSVWCHHHGVHPADGRKKRDQVEHTKRYGSREEANAVSSVGEKNRRSLNMEEMKEASGIPYSHRRMEKMLEKAILKIITGDLSTGDMLLLKSLNYSLEEVLAIRERELSKKDEELRKKESVKSWTKALYGENGGRKTRYWENNSMDHSSPRNPDYEDTRNEGNKNHHVDRPSQKDFDFDAYNRQAVLDYENLPTNGESQQPWSEPAALDYEETTKASKEQDPAKSLHRDFDKAMASHVVFKIRYDDSEFDSSSGSDESSKYRSKTPRHHVSATLKHTTSRNAGSSFHASPPATLPSVPLASVPLPVVHQLGSNVKVSYPKNLVDLSSTTSSTESPASTTERSDDASNVEENTNGAIVAHTTSSTDETVIPKAEGKLSGSRKVSEYEGLEWVEDDVYRVIPEFVESLGYENTEENETSDYEDTSHSSRHNWNTEDSENDTLEYQNDMPDTGKHSMVNGNVSTGNLPTVNLSTYQQVALAHRRDQGEKAIEDIKSRVLALTGRFNNSSTANQVQRERLTMFSPTCLVPRNTDQDAWADPLSMNMHFQLNLTSGDHVVAAKLRIFKLPQENLTSSAPGIIEEEEEDEKKIRISVYYYTKSLKKHRSKKRLMDSVVTALTSEGTHLALDVRQSLRFWRLNPRNSHGNGSNHGLVIQVEDQDGRPLKPALYIQPPSCADQDSDQKAYQRGPALFIRACTRYVRIVNGETVTYVNCRH